MGYMRHHAIIVTAVGAFEDAVREAWAMVEQAAHNHNCPEILSPLSEVVTNGARSFALFPDGSKEGWPESDSGDSLRDEVVRILEGFRYEDGSSPLAWVEVQFADDELESKIIRDSDGARRAAK